MRKINPRYLLMSLATAGLLIVAPPTIGYALGANDLGASIRQAGAVEQADGTFEKRSVFDIRQDDNDNDVAIDNDNDEAFDNDNDGDEAFDNDNGDDGAVDKDGDGIDDITGEPTDVGN